MKKVIACFLILTMLLSFAACGNNPTETSSAVSEQPATSSEEEPSLYREIDGVQYYDVQVAGARGKTYMDDSKYFIEGVEGYYIAEDCYGLDRETFLRVVQTPCKGDGSIRCLDFKTVNYQNNSDPFDGILPVDKFNDPMYVFMCAPAQASNYFEEQRDQAVNMLEEKERFDRIMTIGALYTIPDKKLPDDAEFTICVGRITLCGLFEGESEWQLLSDLPKCQRPTALFYLPWEMEHTVGVPSLDSSKVTEADDHWEIKLTGYEFNATAERDKGAEAMVFHFWGENYKLNRPGDELIALAGSFEIWVKEEEWANYFVATAGADWREEGGAGEQAFAGYNTVMTTEPQVVFGHNVGPKEYDKLMDSKAVCEMMHLGEDAVSIMLN